MKSDDKLAIHELLSRAAYCFDVRDIDGLEACFSGDARMLVEIAGGETFGPFEGRDSIMELMRGTLAAQTDRRRHVICDFIFESARKNEATVISTVLVSSVADGEISLVTSGVYRDTVQRKGSDWHIVDRHLDLDRQF